MPVAKSLGVTTGRVRGKRITASSVWNKYHGASLARLHLKKRGRYVGGWAAKTNNRRQWVQVDLKRFARVTKVATQGRSDAKQYVTSYAVAYSPDGRRWTPYKENSRLKVSNGLGGDKHMTGRNTPVCVYHETYEKHWNTYRQADALVDRQTDIIE